MIDPSEGMPAYPPIGVTTSGYLPDARLDHVAELERLSRKAKETDCEKTTLDDRQ